MAIALITVAMNGRSVTSAAAQTQRVSIIDGDTLQIDGRIVQLYGIDAPELGQRCLHEGLWIHCGLDAAWMLRKLIRFEDRTIRCIPHPGADQMPRDLCLIGQIDLAHRLLEEGYVVASAEATEGYREAENVAQQADLGLWHSQFVTPSDWRKGSRLPNEASQEEDCPVKAVISANGDRRYYVPTDDAYERIPVDRSKGGRYFCSDEQARLAGWRREVQAVPDGTAG